MLFLASCRAQRCVVAATISLGSLFPRGGPTFTRGGGGVVAIVFFWAVLPYVVSCWRNIDREAETTMRITVFVIGLIGISIVVNIVMVRVILAHYSVMFLLLLVYPTQASAYLFMGNLLLEPGPDNDGFDW
jgi:hypothetical protein